MAGVATPRAALILALGATLSACAMATPPDPSPGRATVWGAVRLVPREGVTPVRPGGGSPYADPALRDVEFVDYSHAGFTVVYLDRTPSPRGRVLVRIRDGRMRPRLDPEQVAVGVGGTLRVVNESAAPHVLSLPQADRIERLEPGEELEIGLPEAGAQSLFLLDAPRVAARLFVAPGRFVVPSRVGRWELRDVEPGAHRLHAWHPRFPPLELPVELTPGRALRLDLELGVDALAGPTHGG